MAPRALADPVLLHEEDVLGPLAEHLVAGEKLLGVVRDLEEPLLHLLLDDRGVAAPAAPADDLFVGQDGPALGAPVDPAFLPEGQAALEHLEEDPLVPLVVIRQAGVHLPGPVVAEAHLLELFAHVGDVVQRPLPGMDAVLDGRVLGRHAQGVPADGVDDVKPVHRLEAGDDVADGIVPDVAHMDAAGGIGIHLEQIVFLFGRVLVDLENPLLGPDLLPLSLDFFEVEVVLHRLFSFRS